MPYWDVSLDNENNGQYYQHPTESMFSSDNFGGQNGGGSGENYELTDGLFAYWPVSEFDPENFDHLDYQCLNEGWFTGYTTTTCEACCGADETCVCGPDDEFKTFMRQHDECNTYVTRNGETWTENQVGGHYEVQFTAEDFNVCTNPNLITTWMEWVHCSQFSDNNCLGRTIDVSVLQSSIVDVENSDGNEEAKDRTIFELEELENDACKLEGVYIDANGNEQKVNSHHGGMHFRMGGDMEVSQEPYLIEKLSSPMLHCQY